MATKTARLEIMGSRALIINLWTVGAIKAAPTSELDKRVTELIKLRDEVDKATQDELDFIYGVVEQRLKEAE